MLNDKCSECNREAVSTHNVIKEIDPVQDKTGQLWATYERVSGPHLRCARHQAPQGEIVIPRTPEQIEATNQRIIEQHGAR